MASLGKQIEKPNVLGLRRTWRFGSSPVDGTSGTLVGVIDPGDLLIDTANKKIYINSGSQASPVYSQILSADVAFEGDVSIEGDVTLTTEDVSIVQGRFLYLDGQDGDERITSDAAGYLMVRALTGVDITIGSTDEVNITATAVTLPTNNLTLTAGHISVAATKYIYLDGQSGTEYIRAVTDGNVIVNAATTVKLGIGGTAEVSVSGDALYPETDNGQTLGIQNTNEWSDLFLAEGGVIGWNNNDVTITHAANLLTVAGGNLRMGTTDRIEFLDATEYMHSANDGYIDLVAATGFRINSEVLIGENSAGHGLTLYGESSGSYLDWQGAEGDSLDLVNSGMTVTQATAGTGVHSAITCSATTSSWTLGFFGQATFTLATQTNVGSGAGGVFEVNMTDAFQGNLTGVTCGVFVGAYSNATGGRKPNAALWIETIPGANADFAATGASSDMPMIALVTSGTNKSTLAIEFGYEGAGKTVPTGVGEMSHNQTIQVKVNGTLMYWPLSTVEGTYTTAYPIVTTCAATAIDIGTAVTGIDMTGTYTKAINIANAVATPNIADGVGTTGSFVATGSGIFGGHFCGMASWVNIADSAQTGAYYVVAQHNGVYEGSATLTGTKVVFGLRMSQLCTHYNVATGTFPFSINTNNNGITALFDVATATDMGDIVNAGSDSGHLIPIFRDYGGNMRYVKVYTAA